MLDESGPTPADRRRERQRVQILDAALDLFEAHGFEETSVDQIAHAGDVSPRTFFRYFSAKEDLVLGLVAESSAALNELVVNRPADEPIDVAICEAAVEWMGELAAAERLVRCVALVVRTPSLAAGFLTRTSLEPVLIEAIGEREPELGDRERSVVAAIGAALLRRSLSLFSHTPIPELVDEIRQTFAVSRTVWGAGR